MVLVLNNLRDKTMEMDGLDNSKIVLERCLISLGFEIIAKDVWTQRNKSILNKYSWLVHMRALREKRFDIIDDMELAGLIYG